VDITIVVITILIECYLIVKQVLFNTIIKAIKHSPVIMSTNVAFKYSAFGVVAPGGEGVKHLRHLAKANRYGERAQIPRLCHGL
jgi:hypothetical protein